MKALSIKQPWAWAIANGHKTIETRTWPTNYQGELLIVASKAPDKAMLEIVRGIAGDKVISQIEYGKAIAIANLIGCRPMVRQDEDAAMCDIYPGAHSWLLTNIRKITPFEVRGQLGIYEVEFKDERSNIPIR